MTKTHYEVIGLPYSATSSEIEEACVRLGAEARAAQATGDPLAPQRYAEIECAYEVLSVPPKRAAYDREIFGENYNGESAKIKNWVSPRNKSKTQFSVAGALLVVITMLWGYDVWTSRSAVAELKDRGIDFNEGAFLRNAGDPALVKLFLAAGMSPNVRNRRGVTPLMSAASAKSIESMRLLISAGADVNAETDDGGTALSAVIAGVEIGRTIEGLVALNDSETSDAVIRMKKLEDAMEKERGKTVNVIVPIVKQLLASGADPTRGKFKGRTILEILNGGDPRSGTDIIYRIVVDAIATR